MNQENKEQKISNDFSLSKNCQIVLSLVSFFIVALGQPVSSPTLSLLAAFFGYAIFFFALLSIKSYKLRFLISAIWFAGIQLIQLSWMTAHPFYYIYAPYLLFASLIGMQFGIIGILITKENISSYQKIIGIAGFLVLLEWSRLFFMSGYSWNPAGLALTASTYSLQMASFFGVFGLSFWVMLTNLIFLKCLISYQSNFKFICNVAFFVLVAVTPFVYGKIHLKIHENQALENTESFTALLVQPSFAVDGADHIRDRKVLIAYVLDQWRHIFEITKNKQNQKFDLIVLPEYVVAFGTYTTVFPLETIKNIFKEVYGEDSLKKLPPLDEHLATHFKKSQKNSGSEVIVFVNNAFILQALANHFDSPIIAGLEDVDDISLDKRNYYSAALYFTPACSACIAPLRYEKRVLVPLGEYIPFSFCRQLAINYGVQGSFTKGESAKVFSHPKKSFGVSICYEETFGHVMRENKLQGAEILVNMTNDGWFPNSTLTKQHFDHARLRSVECGMPLIRACNTGITGGFDSFGNIIATLGSVENPKDSLSDSLLIEVPTYTYQTIYSKYGDHLILAFSVIAVLGLILKKSLI